MTVRVPLPAAVPAVVLVLALGLALVLPGGAAAGRADPEGRVERVLVVALPAVSWAELAAADVPTLDALVADSAMANVSVRGVYSRTSEEDGYATLGSGTRSVGSPGGGAAADVLGESASVPGVVVSSFERLVARNDSLTYGAELGALGEALAAEAMPRAVVGNADGATPAPDAQPVPVPRPAAQPVPVHRPAALATVDATGTTPGEVGPQLLVEDPDAPAGLRADVEEVARALGEAWDRGGLVLVDTGDLSRADTGLVEDAANRVAARMQALATIDDLVAGIDLDPERDAVVLVGPSHRYDDPHLTVLAVRAPGVDAGLLRSASTRRDGVVMLVDVAPTLLDLVGVDRPTSMEGRAATVGTEGGTPAQRWERLVQDDERAAFRDAQVTSAAVVYVVAQALLWVALWVVLRRTAPARPVRSAAAIEVAALAAVAFLPLTYVANLLPGYRMGAASWWGVVVAASLVVAVLARRAGRGTAVGPVLAVSSLVVGVLAVDAVLGTPLQYNAVFGYSPTVGGRFAGLGNLAFAQLAAGAILVAVVAGRRLPEARAWWLAAAILAAAVVVDGAPSWGADVGGVLALVPAALVTLLVLSRGSQSHRMRSRRQVRADDGSGPGMGPGAKLAVVAGAATAAVVVLAGFAAIDLGRPEDDRTHLGRLVQDVADEGAGPLLDVATRKLDANLSVLTRSVWTLMVPVVLVALGLVVWRAPGRLAVLFDRVPELRAALAGLAVAMVLGFALNDSGIAVPGVMLGVVNASLVALLIRTAVGTGDLSQPSP